MFLNTIVKLFKPITITFDANFKTTTPLKITFLADNIMANEIEKNVKIWKQANSSRSEFFRYALKKFIEEHSKPISIESFWYNTSKKQYTRRYSFILNDELARNFNNLDQECKRQNINLSKSQFVRCAIANELRSAYKK